MERGLLWLPLLAVFIGLAWAGWNEYQKVEAYRQWAESLDRAKYDIYAVLGQKGKQIFWGKPARGKPQQIQGFSLDDVAEIRLLVQSQPVADLDAPPKGDSALEFRLTNNREPVQIPFTDSAIAARWCRVLKEEARAKLEENL